MMEEQKPPGGKAIGKEELRAEDEAILFVCM